MLLNPAAAGGGVAALPKGGLVVRKVLPALFAADAVEGVVPAVLLKGGVLLLLVLRLPCPDQSQTIPLHRPLSSAIAAAALVYQMEQQSGKLVKVHNRMVVTKWP